MAMRILTVILAAACLAQAEGPDTSRADKLNADGVAFFKNKEYAKAAEAYREAVAAYAEALGKESPGYLSAAVTLDRAIAWCEAQAGELPGLARAFAAFYDDAVSLGGNEKEEQSVRSCLNFALIEAARRKAMPDMEAIYPPYRDTIEKALARAKADPRGETLAPLVDRLATFKGGTMVDWFIALYLAGDRKRGAEAYADAIAWWKERNEVEESGWAPHNAFFNLAKEGDLADAAFFVVETLAAIRKSDLPSVETKLWVNLRDALARAREEKNAGAAPFLMKVIEGAGSAKVLTAGLDEAYFRGCLDEFLRSKETADERLKNADALSLLAKASKDPHLVAQAALFAAEALGTLGKADEAVARAEEAAKEADAIGDLLTLGAACLSKARTLAAKGDHAFAGKAIERALDAFKKAEDEVAAVEARTLGLENARAEKNGELAAKFEEALSSASAAGGANGHSIGDMEPERMVTALKAAGKTVDLLEITREGDRLAFKNLLDGKVAYDDLQFPFHNVNVSGFLFQVRGPELLLDDLYDNRSSPGAKGDVSMAMGGRVQASHGSDFTPFRKRVFVEKGVRVRVNSALELYRVKE